MDYQYTCVLLKRDVVDGFVEWNTVELSRVADMLSAL